MVTDKELKKRFYALDQKIKAIKERKKFKRHFHDGHMPSHAELKRYNAEMKEKIDSDLHAFEEKFGHLGAFGEQFFLLLEAIEM